MKVVLAGELASTASRPGGRIDARSMTSRIGHQALGPFLTEEALEAGRFANTMQQT
jgi:hypothetical protein